MQKHSLSGKTLTLKVKFYDFQQITRSVTRKYNYTTEEDIFACARTKLNLVCHHEFPQKRIRLLGVGISNLAAKHAQVKEQKQLEIFSLF